MAILFLRILFISCYTFVNENKFVCAFVIFIIFSFLNSMHSFVFLF